MLASFVQATHTDGSPMTNAEIRDQLVTMLAAGHETTAHQLSWTVERLRRHPELLARLDRRSRRRRPRSARRHDPRVPAHAPGDLLRRPLHDPALRARRLPPPERRDDRPLCAPHALRPPPVRRPAAASTPTASSTSSRTPTPGSPSAAACAAASAPASPTWRWTSCSAPSWSASPSCQPQAPDEPWKFRGVAWAPGHGGLARIKHRAAA